MEQELNDQGLVEEEVVPASEESAETTGTPEQATVEQQDTDNPDVIQHELDELRKRAEHGNRKITELGQARSELQKELGLRDVRIQALENQINTLSRYQQPAPSAADGYYDDVQPSDQPPANGVPNDQFSLYSKATEELVTEYGKLQSQVDELRGVRERDSKTKELMESFGLSAEDAETAMKFRDDGDDISFGKVISLGSAYSRARSEKKQQRRESIDAASTVNEGSASPSSSTATSDQQADDIITGKVQSQGVAKMLAENPDLLDKLSKQFTVR